MNFDRFARFYDGDYREFVEDIPLVLGVAELAGPTALELGCGTGRLLLPLAQAGVSVTGVDGSGALLALARAKAAAAGLDDRIHLILGDMKRVSLDSPYDLVFVVSNTLMHLASQKDQLAALSAAFRNLRSGGRLLIDLFNPDLPYLESISGVQELADRWEDPVTGCEVIKWTTRTLDAARQVLDTVFVYEEICPEGREEQTEIAFPLRYWLPEEGVWLLGQAGFQVEHCWGDFDRRPFTPDSERLIFMARKP